MDLNLSDEQTMLRDTFRAFFRRECPVKVVRDAAPVGYSDVLWGQLCAVDAPGLGAAAEVGGGGAGLVELALVAEELGAALAPVPFIEHTVAVRLLGAVGRSDWLKDAVRGRPIVSLALHAGAGPQLVPAGALAGHVLVLDGEHLRLVAHSAPMVPNLGDLPLAQLEPDSDGTPLLIGRGAVTAHRIAVDEWRVLTAAALVGLSEAALAVGVEYGKTRRQFGVPIGSFQALAHSLAEVRGPLNGARLLTLKAAWAADHDDGRRAELARMAFAFAADLAQEVTYRSMHCHGGYGVMEEYDIQLYFRRARGWPQVLHDSGREVRELADELFGPIGGPA